MLARYLQSLCRELFISQRCDRLSQQLGRICLDILKDKWSPALQIRTVLLRRAPLRSLWQFAVVSRVWLLQRRGVELWSPLLSPVRSIQALLSAPNPDDPLADNIAKHWKENEAEAVATGERLVYAGIAAEDRAMSGSCAARCCASFLAPSIAL